MEEILSVIVRTIIILVITFILFKMMGKKQVSQMNMFDYIIGITIGSIIAEISIDLKQSFILGVISLILFCLSSIIVSILSLKSVTLRAVFNNKETPLIINGCIDKKTMSKNKITVNMLQTEARQKGYFNLNEINNAILEPNGMISFEPKEKEKPVSKRDMNINSRNKGLVYNLIIDGVILEHNLANANKNKKWLNHELNIKGKKLEDILLLTIDSEEKINIYLK